MIINGIYDIICGISLLITDKYFSRFHLSIFIKKPDEIMQRFLGYWIITYGCIRLFLGIYNEYSFLITLSYLIEILAFEYESYLSNNLYKYKIRFISLSSIIIIIFLFINMK